MTAPDARLCKFVTAPVANLPKGESLRADARLPRLGNPEVKLLMLGKLLVRLLISKLNPVAALTSDSDFNPLWVKICPFTAVIDAVTGGDITPEAVKLL